MQALVHFTVGVFMAMAVFLFVDLPPRREFLLTFLSGFWGMGPDVHWVFREFGVDALADPLQAFHRTAFADLFWFHRLIDSLETGRENLEAAVALGLLLVLVAVYYRYNDWTDA
jgi:hypothetical protein